MPGLGLVRPRIEGAGRAAIRAYIERVEALGYASIWLGESWGYEAFSQFGWIAGFTERIEIGCGIVNVFSRTPALIGQGAATVDALSGGRFLLGLGTSGHRVVENWHGLPYDRPLRRLREYLEVIRLVTSGARVNYEGQIFRLSGFKLEFAPVRARLPIYVASLAPVSIRQTGELADGWNPVFLRLSELPRFRAELARGAARTGRDPKEVAIAPYLWVLVTDETGAARAFVKAEIARYLCNMGVHYARHISAQGFAEEVGHVQRAYAADRSAAYAAVPDALVDSFAIIGPAGHCRAQLEAYFAAGIERPLLSFPARVGETVARETLEALAPVRWLG